jgi:hypothetical protein
MRVALISALACALACATGAPAPDPQRGAVWGYVRLVPKGGAATSGDAYADRRLRDAALFDYSHPSFAVVYAAGGSAAAATSHTLSLEDSPRGLRWAPDHVAMGSSDELVVANRSPRAQIVSAPDAAWLRGLAPGASASLRPAQSGELALHMLGSDAPPALVWVAPGAFASADSAGRYELRGLEPGVASVRAWHPRLPPSAAREITLRAGEIVRLDLEIGVDRGERNAR